MLYVIARSISPSGASRPTFQHILAANVSGGDETKTLCGRDISRWSRVISGTLIEVMLCKNCVRRSNAPLKMGRARYGEGGGSIW